jgi:hypothetical protein
MLTMTTEPKSPHLGRIVMIPGVNHIVADSGGQTAVRTNASKIYSATIWMRCARRSWRVPAGESPARVRGSARPVVSVAAWKATTTAKRTQRSRGVWE